MSRASSLRMYSMGESENLSFDCLRDLELLEDPSFMQQWPHLDSTFIEDHNQYSYNNNNNNHDHVLDFNRGTIFDRDNNNDNSSNNNTPSPCIPIISMSSISPPPSNSLVDSGFSSTPRSKGETRCNNFLNFSFSSPDQPVASTKRVVSTRSRLAHDHIVAERKRREKLSLKFIALSALVPGLKKMDKASVLGDAINHIKQLQHKVKALEDQSKRTKVESFVFVRKYEVQYATDTSEHSSADDDRTVTTESPLPEIEARSCDKDVLVNVHCEKRKGVLEKTVSEIEKFHLSVVNSSVVSFGDSSLKITVVAKKHEEFNVNMEVLLNNLRSALM